MRTNAPTLGSWLIGLVCFVLALLVQLGHLPQLRAFALWIALVGLGLLLLASVFKRL
ncbi:MAG: hypothetical protein SFY70_09500 [Bacteroidia bacterium]|nr:hypothetical protein [Bacteroidia bacterium]